jgi:hypothetical protein
MDLNTFSENLEVRYKKFIGRIKFISEEYLTLCIAKGTWDVCILIFRPDWKYIQLLKESDK